MTGPYTPGSWRARFRWPARVAYFLLLLFATLSPFHLDPDRAHVTERLERALHPLIAGSDVVDAARNILLFAGWGVIWALTAAGSGRRTILRSTGTGICISLLVESAQLFSSNRNSSLMDVTTNTIGSLGGALALLMLIAFARERRGVQSLFGIPALVFAGSYVTAVFLEAVVPLFWHDTLPGGYGWPLARFAVSSAAFRWSSVLSSTVSDFPLFLPAGALAVAALTEFGLTSDAALRRVVPGGVALALVAELVHGLLGMEMLLGAFLLRGFAIAVGAWLATRALPRIGSAPPGPERARRLFLLYGAVLAAWAWRPFLPDWSLRAIRYKLSRPWYIPLASSEYQLDLYSVVLVCAPFFLYLPLGALLAAWPIRRHGPLAGPWPGVLLALFLETAQLVVRERQPDITDFLVAASGAIIGWAIIRRAGYEGHGG
ncbi:MAG: VanZ family protein [Gemmatimonadota bacterium]